MTSAWMLVFLFVALQPAHSIRSNTDLNIEDSDVKDLPPVDSFPADPDSFALLENSEEEWFENIGTYSNFAGVSDNARKFVQPFEALAFGSRQDRRKEWTTAADYNGNGHMSLAEMDSYIEKKLKRAYGKEGLILWKAFRPSYIRSFYDAKDITPDKQIAGTSSSNDDYIQWPEFRAACHYICIYALMYDKFAMVDGYGYGGEVGEFAQVQPGTLKGNEWDDRRIDEDEFVQGSQALSESGFVGLRRMSDPERTFRKIDSNGGGYILLNEWCAFLKEKEIDAGTEMGNLLSLGDE